jgi:hypothetical protein
MQRVNFDLVEIDLGRLKWGEVEVVLVHERAKLARNPEDAAKFKEAQDGNKILLFNSDAKEIGWISTGRCLIANFSAPVFVKVTQATALLHVTALPV